MALLEVGDLRVEFRTARGRVRAVDGVSFQLDRGEALAVVGESGSGKTALALAILRLLPEPPGRITGGKVLLRGRDLLELDPEEMLPVRGRRIAMVFQEPATALNPVLTVGEQVAEAVRLHRTRRAVRPLVLEALAQAGVPDPERRLGQYPHQLSGGLRQRVVVAMALVCGPEILIADEPTTALDVTVQARLLDLLAYLRARLGLALLLITHDLGVVARTADRVAVMYAGKLVETSPVRPFFARPAHPYSLGLLEASRLATTPRGDLATVEGSPPDLADPPPGCPFEPRCPRAGRLCREEPPPGLSLGRGRAVACHRPLVGP
ncbi:MAG: ABC transporter ATP-binding protein [Firmicutes bacterium]|nr:ABC transporter ATP-binding protein [Bacillota bacterium]